ncbi:uncharacterized protein BO66DRAFT_442114 [Aspergillus aculeatinus CBS 121060]|uniref:Uncharacterized protein n=1 Tax=Aspergillus aculeatinus CBS 121060 TaxID=1448322 RepID=A0ACD1GYL7_9EURO|nr:hypothetical protein BO66DRAFT_442114 [Aspergillus aculeatinus CBS 121060]RAH66309.1 hypothetical protein BO66DRAFT_442114 [Aspergillus aculeatinus CBS 121060]
MVRPQNEEANERMSDAATESLLNGHSRTSRYYKLERKFCRGFSRGQQLSRALHLILLSTLIAFLIAYIVILQQDHLVHQLRAPGPVLSPPQLSSSILPHAGHLPRPSAHWTDCGSSPEEAISKGCRYDVILVAWVPADCFDEELMESYLAEVEYPFWLDRALQQSTTLMEVRRGIHPVVFSNQEFHMAHCAYFLEMSIRGFRQRRVWDNTTLDMEHMRHCARTVRDHWLPEMGYSPLHMVWHSCGRPEE